LSGNTAYCVKLSGEEMSRYSNEIESVGLRKCHYYLRRFCLSATAQFKLPNGFAWNFSGKVDNGPTNKWLNFGGYTRITVWIQVLFSGFVSIGRCGKWLLTDINLLLILIRQMTSLARRALAEVCSVMPWYKFGTLSNQWREKWWPDCSFLTLAISVKFQWNHQVRRFM